MHGYGRLWRACARAARGTLAGLLAAGPADLGAQVLPEPEGDHAIGYWRTVVVDSQRTAPDATGPRRIPLEVWYPAARGGGTAVKPYTSARLDSALSEQFGLALGWSRSVRANAATGVAADTGARPVVVFSHGLSFPVLLYQSLTEDLASRGYVVIAVSHPAGALYDAGPHEALDTVSVPSAATEDERQAQLARITAEWSRDVRKVIDGLPGLARSQRAAGASGPALRLDLDRIALVGHSLGGSAVAHLTNDGRVRAVALLEGKFRDTTATSLAVRAPLMHVIGEYNRLELENRDYLPTAGAPVYQVVIGGTGHAYFSDLIHIYRQTASPEWLARHRYELDTRRILQITRDYLAAFFGRYLRGEDSVLLHPPSYSARVEGPRAAGYPEVRVTIDVP